MRYRGRALVAAGAAALLAMTAAACGGDDDGGSSGSGGLVWWHNGSTEPLRGIWDQAAKDFMAAHPDISIDVVPIQNEQFPTRIPLALQGDDPPHIYFNQGGGLLATHTESGKIADITDLTAPWIEKLGPAVEGWQVDGRQYGVPYNLHIVGFWYNKDLFAQAGITEEPETLDELNAVVEKLKAAGIPPIAVGGRDRWPDAFYFNYFAIRNCSVETLRQASADVDISAPCFTKAAEDLAAFLETEPFTEGFLGIPAQEGAGSSAGMVASGKAAMELQGDWELGQMKGLVDDPDLASKLGWFPFPQIEGGEGDPMAVLGGGDGFSCTTRAPEQCVQFLEYISDIDVQTRLVEEGVSVIPANPAAASAVSDEVVQENLDYAEQVTYIQTYLDIAWPSAVGQALNDAVANLFAGEGSPADIIQAVKEAAANS
ncbi:MAG: extracellular solute-binding protein [Frankia sp.]|nr:extracellular solute-binding protein [Frankia sp.]